MTGSAFKLGTVLSLGWFWMRTEGCHAVYVGQDGAMGDYDQVQAVMEMADVSVSIAGQALAANTIHHYIQRQISGCGLESEDSQSCIVRIDANGDMLDAAPNAPLDLQIFGAAGGKFLLRWRYAPSSQDVAPTGFRVYIDSGAGFDFESPDATISYGLGGDGEFNWTSDALSEGSSYKFCVRSYVTAGGESQNTNYVSGVADATGPDAVTSPTADYEVIDA